MLKTINLQPGERMLTLKSDDRIFTLTGEADIVQSYRKSVYEKVDFKEASETILCSVFKVTSEYLDEAERLAREAGLLPAVVSKA